MPNDQKKPNRQNMSPEGSEVRRGKGREGGAGAGGSSGQAGNVSLWRGASRLGAALFGFSFKHHDSGVEMEKKENTGLGPPIQGQLLQPSLGGSSAERPAAILQRGLLGA